MSLKWPFDGPHNPCLIDSLVALLAVLGLEPLWAKLDEAARPLIRRVIKGYRGEADEAARLWLARDPDGDNHVTGREARAYEAMATRQAMSRDPLDDVLDEARSLQRQIEQRVIDAGQAGRLEIRGINRRTAYPHSDDLDIFYARPVFDWCEGTIRILGGHGEHDAAPDILGARLLPATTPEAKRQKPAPKASQPKEKRGGPVQDAVDRFWDNLSESDRKRACLPESDPKHLSAHKLKDLYFEKNPEGPGSERHVRQLLGELIQKLLRELEKDQNPSG